MFHDTKYIKTYNSGRFTISKDAINKIIAFLAEKTTEPYGLALDIGCGAGNVTFEIAPFFTSVIGLDPSDEQLELASLINPHKNIQFRKGYGERLDIAGIEDSSVDLIIMSLSYHWTFIPAIHSEMMRVLKPGGCVAIYATKVARVLNSNRELIPIHQDPIQEFMFLDVSAEFWENSMNLTMFHTYDNIELPLSNQTKTYFNQQVEWSIGEIIGYVNFPPGVGNMRKQDPTKFKQIIKKLAERLLAHSGNKDSNHDLDSIMIPLQLTEVMTMARK